MKKFISSVILLIFILSISGCSNKPTPSKTSSNNIQSAPLTTTQEPAPQSTPPPQPEIEPEPIPSLGDYKIMLYQAFADDMEQPITLSDATIDFIKENENFFPYSKETDREKWKSYIDYEIGFKHIQKNNEKYNSTLIGIPGTVVDISELESDGEYITILHIVNPINENFYALHLGELEDVFQGDNVAMIGLPLGNSGFSNVSGGTTKVVLIASSMTILSENEE